jgi:RNA polymerase sigma-70 factor (ECF subfamily)
MSYIERLLAELTPESREAFVATQVRGLSYAAAAEACGCSLDAIRCRVARAREELVLAVRIGQAGASRTDTPLGVYTAKAR